MFEETPKQRRLQAIKEISDTIHRFQKLKDEIAKDLTWQELCDAKMQVEAIKRYRLDHDVSLMDAKKTIDEHIATSKKKIKRSP